MSRRLGRSLGVNLLPADGKVCSFDCVYCECGLNAERRPRQDMPSRSLVASALRERLLSMRQAGQALDAITFSGTGEPTSHPHFGLIVDDVISTGESLKAMEKLVAEAGGEIAAKMAVLAEGDAMDREDIFALEKLPLFNSEGQPID